MCFHIPLSTDIAPCHFYLIPSMKKTFTGTPFFDIRCGENNIAGNLMGGCEKWVPAMLQEIIPTLAKVCRRPR